LKKKGFYWLFSLLAIVLLPLLLLNNNKFQQKLLQRYAQLLALEYNLEPDFDSFHFQIDKNILIQFEGLRFADSLGQDFFRAERLDINARTLPLLLYKQLDITDIRLIGANIQVYRVYHDSPLNIAYLGRLFNFERQIFNSIRISSLLMKDCSFSYDVITAPELSSDPLWADKEIFDVNHIAVKKLNTKLSLKIPRKAAPKLTMNSFSMEEAGGFVINDLILKAIFDDNSLKMDNFSLVLPESSMGIDKLELAYDVDSGGHPKSFVLKDPVDVKLALNFSDITAFLPFDLQLDNSSADLAFTVVGGKDHLELNELYFQIDSVVYFNGNVNLNEIGDEKQFKLLSTVDFLHLQPEALHLIQAVFSIQDSVIPPVVNNLGEMDFCGMVALEPENWNITGEISADPGKLSILTQVEYSSSDAVYDFNLHLNSDSYALNKLFDSRITLGKTAFEIDLNGKKAGIDPPIADLKAIFKTLQINNYTYRNIVLDAYYNGYGFYNANLNSGDKNCLLDLAISLNDLGDEAAINCSLNAHRIDLQSLNWMPAAEEDKGSELSFNMQADLKGNTLQQLRGRLNIDSLRFENNGELFELDNFYALSGENGGERYVLLKSDLLEGWMYGYIDMTNLLEDARNKALLQYFPTLFPDIKGDTRSMNNYDFRFKLDDTRSLSRALNLPLSLPSGMVFDGYFRDESALFALNLNSETIELDGWRIRSLKTTLDNPSDSLQWHFSGILEREDTSRINVDFAARALNNELYWETHWHNDTGSVYKIYLSNILRFERENPKSPLSIFSALNPSEFVVRDSLWKMESSDLQWDGKKLIVNNFLVHHNNQHIKLDGTLAAGNEEEFLVDLSEVNLDYIFELLPRRREKPLLLGGSISGAAQIINLFEEPKLNASLSVENFSLNKAVLGDLNVNSSWNEEISGIEMNGILLDGGLQVAEAKGAIFPAADSIYLWIDAEKARLSFIGSFIEDVIENLDGYGSGYVEIAGTFSNEKVGVTSDCYVEGGVIGVDLLHCNYYFNDSLHLTPQGIFFKNINARDNEGNPAVINGTIRHNYFKDFALDLNIQTEKLKVFDIEPSYSEPFYGRVYATGTAMLNGPLEDIQMDINMRTDERSSFAITLSEESEVSDYSFIEFVDRDKEAPKDSINEEQRLLIPLTRKTAETPEGRLNLNLQIEATPSAEIILITNPTTGDEIRGRGNGSIRLVYDNIGDIELYGRYTLESGSYQFIIQDLLRRDFNILQGSTINFSGDPLEAEMNINAIYSVVNVSLSDLLDEAEIAALNLNRSSIPVNCSLLLTGELQHPNIELGLDFPSADEELKRRVMNVINTDEMLNRQIVYLMLLNRFAAAENTQAQAGNNVNAVVGATLSSLSNQLNNMIYQALGSSFLTFDFNYRYDDLVSQGLGEWQLAMSSQLLDNRLIINGNIGSREDLVSNNTQFIGDFDLEYKFSQSGRWRLKMFNRSNDNRYFKSAMTTQGVGLGYRESFNNLLELRQLFAERIADQIIKSLKESDLKK